MKTLPAFLIALFWASVLYAQSNLSNAVLTPLPATYQVERLPFNSADADFAPTFYHNGLLFCRNVRGGFWNNVPQLAGNIDIYYTELASDGKYDSPVKIKGDANTAMHEGPAAVSPNGKHLYFTQERRQTGQKTVWGIFDAELMYGKWAGVKLFNQGFKLNNLAHPAFSADGNKLYFSADIPGGQGGMDIYVCDRKGNFWGIPQNLGTAINTKGDEIFPFVHGDGALYFASNGRGGLGGLDIFRADNNGGKWLQALALPSPINSPKDDFSISVAGNQKTGYFSSTREGNADIFSFTITETEKLVSFYTDADVDSKTARNYTPPSAVTTPTQNSVAVGSVATTLVTNEATPPAPTLSMYELINAEKFNRENPILNEALGITATPFGIGSALLLPTTTSALDKVAALLQSNQTLMIEIVGHTDARGDASANMILSTKRANAARNYLMLQNIAAERVVARGYGETRIGNYCKEGINCPEEKHAENNRLEFYLIHGQLLNMPVSYAVQSAPTRGAAVLTQTAYEVQVGPLKNVDTRTYYEYKQINRNLSFEDTPKGKVAIFGPYATEEQAQQERVKVSEHTAQKANTVVKMTTKAVSGGGIKDERPQYELFVGPYKHVTTDIYYQFTQLNVRTGVRYMPKGMMVVLGPFDSMQEAEAVEQKLPKAVLSRKTYHTIYTDNGKILLKTNKKKK